VDFIPINPRFPRGLRWLRRFPYVRTLLNQACYLPSLWTLSRADVVHVFSASYWSFLLAPAPAMLVARLLGKRIVLHYHSGEAEDHLSHWGIGVHPWLRLADVIAVPSEYLRQVFARFGYEARVIRNVLDTARYHYRERIPLKPKLLSVRNLEPHYRVDVTLKAFILLKRYFPDATLTIAGYGSEERRLRQMAEILGVDGLCFAGRVEPDRLPALYDEADIFINSAVIDNQPVSVLEAFAAGLVVVSTPCGDIPAMLGGGRAGCLVPPEDPVALSKTVAALLKDPEHAAGLVRSARAELPRYDWARIGEEWAEVYQQ
jgi:glycosyltransferase involved in cell wall biosynthesis